MCNLNMQNSCHPLCKRDKPDNYLIMQIQETVRTNLNMQKFLGQRGGEGGLHPYLVIVDSKQIEEAQIETFNESANNLANLTLNLLEIFDLVLQSPGVESNKCYGLGGGGWDMAHTIACTFDAFASQRCSLNTGP